MIITIDSERCKIFKSLMWTILLHFQWVPVTKLGRLVKDMKIKTLEHIYLFSLPIKVFTCICSLGACLEAGCFCLWLQLCLVLKFDLYTCFLPFRSMRSLTSSLGLPWKTRFSKSCQCRNRPEQDSVHASRPLLPLGTAMDMLVLVWSAPRR